MRRLLVFQLRVLTSSGWAPKTWKPFLQQLGPPLVVLRGSLHAQPGFLMAILAYNEERSGLDRCHVVTFYPRNGAEEGFRPKRKALEQAHMADHVLAQVSAMYTDFRLAATKAVRKRHLFRTVSKEVEPPAKVARAAGDGEAAAAGSAGSAGSAGVNAAGPEANPAEAGSSPAGASRESIKASLFIGVHGNCGPRATLLAMPADKSAEDSDDENCGGNAGDMSHSVTASAIWRQCPSTS